MPRIRRLGATVMSTVLVLSLVATVSMLGIGVAGAMHPTDAPEMSDQADFTVELPSATDHYPGSQNAENGSIEYYASGADAFAAQNAEEGIYIDWIILHAEYEGEDWIDYSACDVPNTGSFGIDRGSNNDGVNYDVGLVSRQKVANFLDNGISINFYDWQDLGNDPPYMAPEDSLVASQGAGSTAGPCLTLTDEPGWYRMSAYINGTIADNGADAQPSESAGNVELRLKSDNYVYVCECDSEQQAREQLGPPPGEEAPSTPSEGSGGDGGSGGGAATPTEAPGGGGGAATPTEAPGGGGGDGGSGGGAATPTEAPGGGGGDGGSGGGAATATEAPGGDGGSGGNQTPTASEGPGFTGVVAVLALLASALVAIRRR